MDQILYWNDVSLEANLVSHTNGKNKQTGPTLSSRALAIMHPAIYDAFVGVSSSTSLTPYLPSPPLPPGPLPPASVDAAITAGGACHTVQVVPQPEAVLRPQARGSGTAGS